MISRFFSFFFLLLLLTHLPARGEPESGWDIFEEDSVEAQSFSSTEGLLSSLIAHQVAAISGEFVEHATDCVLVGPEPLSLQRSYSAQPSIHMFGYEPAYLDPERTIERGSKYCGWQFNHLTSLYLQIDLRKHEKHAQFSAFVPHAFFSQMLHRDLIKISKGVYPVPECMLPLLHQKGVTNCSSGAISGRTNPKNVIAHLKDKHKTCNVSFGSGHLRHYTGHLRDRIGGLEIWKYAPRYEKKANGNQIIYQNDHLIEAYNPSGSTLYSSLKFKRVGDHEIHVETSHSSPLIYRYEPFKVKISHQLDYKIRYYLTSLTRPDQPHESYAYTLDAAKEGWLLCRKEQPHNRFLEIDYYGMGDQPGKMVKLPIQNLLDPRINRVKCLKAPVGADATPIVTHTFFYDLSYDINHKKKKTTTYEGVTTVYDVYHRKSMYIYNAHHRLDKVIHYTQDKKPYIQTHYVWEESANDKKGVGSYDTPNQGNLMGKVVQDGQGHFLTGRFFDYDKRGNILKETFYGNLTGTCSSPLQLDSKQRPLANGVEFYERNFSYSHDAFNLLLEEKETSGRQTLYFYLPHSDLLSSKLLLAHEKICAREFYTYDENNTLITSISDNGTGKDKEDLSDVSERHITYYFPRKTIPIGLPERIDEMIVHLASGQEQLLKRTVRTYSLEGRLLKQEVYNAAGEYCYVLEWEYDAHGNMIKECNALGQTVYKQYDENDNLIFEQGPSLDFYTQHTYDFSNRRICTERIHTSGEHFVTHFRYDLAGNRIAQVDRYGNETSYDYDAFNRLIATHYPSVEESSPIVTKIAYDCLDNVIEESDARGFTTQKTYNARGKVTSILHPDGQLEKFEYLLNGTLVKKIASNGTESHFEVDCFGRILSEKVYAINGEFLYATNNTYNSLHKTSSTDAAGLTTYFEYDEAGRLIQTICQDKIERYAYDLLGRLAQKQEPFETDQIKVTCLEYDFLDRMIEERIENEQGKVLKKVSYQYDLLGNRTHIIEETHAGLSQQVTFYNADKKPIQSLDPENNATHIVYHYNFCNASGQCVLQTLSTDPLGRQTTITYDTLERPITIKQTDLFGVLLSHQDLHYDAQANLTRLLDHVIVEGQETKCLETTFTYQETSQLTSLTLAKGLPEQHITHATYNCYGQKEKVIKPDGIQLDYTYDALGRVASYTSSEGTVAYHYLYDARHQPLQVKDGIQNTTHSFKYDLKGRLITEALANGVEISYEYDLLDRVTALILPADNRITYQYDAAHLRQVSRFKQQEQLYTHCYDLFDLAGLNLQATTLHQQTCTATYDRCKRPLAMKNSDYKQEQVLYDSVGRLCQYHMQDPVGSLQITYSYDDNDHLISEEGHLKQTYSCDSLHNRLKKNQNTCLSNGLHQLISDGIYTYTYDRAGNLTTKKKGNEITSYRYDAQDRLIAVKNERETHYVYDAFHRRITKQEGEHTLRYLYVGQNEIGSLDETGHIQELRILGQGQGAEMGANIAIELQEQVFIPSHDFRGNIISLANRSGQVVESYRYTAFGETTIYNAQGEKTDFSTLRNPWRFASKRYDEESGFIYFGRRYYDANQGRWITADPAGLGDGPNLYAYLHHHPTKGFDLYGLQEEGAQQEPYYPLQNVEHDKTSHSPSPEDVAPNEPPLGFIERKVGKKGKMYYCGLQQIAEMGIGYINGIMNSLRDACATANQISKMAGDHYVTFLHNESHGFLVDLVRCACELYFYAQTPAVKNLQEKWSTFFRHAGPDAIYYHECHSEGAIITRNALRSLPKELRQRIIVTAYAPAAYIDDEYAYQVTHYRSARDLVPLLDFVGFYKCRHSTIVLQPHVDAPLFDHSINSPTFQNVRQASINFYQEQYGGRVCTPIGL